MDSIFYTPSLKEALQTNQLGKWAQSHLQNIQCAQSIQKALWEYEDETLPTDTAEKFVEEYSYNRMGRVLAASVQEIGNECFCAENAEWLKQFSVPADIVNGNYRPHEEYSIAEDTPHLDHLISQTREAYQSLNLWAKEHCVGISGIDLTGHVLALDPQMLGDQYKTPEDQLFLAESGFGCAPNSSGRKVYGQFLKDGEQTYFYREDFIGELKAEYLPDWVKEKLAALAPEQETGPQMQL